MSQFIREINNAKKDQTIFLPPPPISSSTSAVGLCGLMYMNISQSHAPWSTHNYSAAESIYE
jgi:hypothetical protein